MTVRLLSWNVHGLPHLLRRRARLARCAREIANRAPMLTLLQEVWMQADVATFGRLLPAGRYQASGTTVVAGFRRGGLLTFVDTTDAWRVESDAYRPFDACAPRWRVWEGDGLLGKGFQVTRLTRGPQEHLTVVNTHLQAEYTVKMERTRYAAVRRAQLEQLIEAVSRAAADGPVLVAGDFNTTPEDTGLHGLIAAHGWIELTEEIRTATGGGTCIAPDGTDREWLDYAFAILPAGSTSPAQASLVRSAARDVPFSDHHGLVVDVSLPGRRC